MDRRGYVYILTNAYNRVLYTGVTSDISARMAQHRSGTGSAFVRRYRAHKLVYYEEHERITEAILREKQLKAGPRCRKVELIESVNPQWQDLSESWNYRP